MAEQLAVFQSTAPSVIRTPDQRLRVFVSSTLEELVSERAAARQAIEQLRLTPVMFELGARPHPPRDLYRAYLAQSHVFVGIYGQQYGWIAPGESVSGLEDEYRLADRHPKLIYLKRVDGARDPRLDKLIREVETNAEAVYREFTSADDLRELIESDLALLLSERFEQLAATGADRLREPVPTNLPVPRNPLVGRDAELRSACELLRSEQVSLVTLTGPGGSGKSRLGLEAALELLSHYEGGAFLVMLESIRDPALVVQAIADTLGVRERPSEPWLEVLADHIGDSHLLLLLDNFEQVVEAATQVSALLELCPHLAVLVTSRTPLRLRAEHELPIPALPTPVRYEPDLEHLSQFAAVALFIQRARAARPDFAVTTANAPAVAEICHRLDGLPLAIELAAARLRILSPEALLARLASRFELLRGGGRDLPERHRTLRRTIDWSHDLLDPDSKLVFRRLAVCAGGATLEAAEALCNLDGDLGADPLDVIAALLDNNMLTVSIGDEGDPRVGMLETMHAYALERLEESGEAEQLRRRHAEHYLMLAEEAEPHLVGVHAHRWATRLQAERDNFRVILEWSLERDVELGLRLGGALWRFWEWHNAIVEAHGWLTALVRLPSTPSLPRATALQAASRAACYLGEYGPARAYVQEALPILNKLGDQRRIASAVNDLGAAALSEGDYAEGARLMRQALDLKREIGDDWLIAKALGNAGLVTGYEGDYARAYELHAESLALFEKLEEEMGAAIEIGNLGHIAMRLGRLDEALERQLKCLRILHEVGDEDGSAECLERLAMIAGALEDPQRAARLLGLAAVLRRRAGTISPAWERREAEDALAATKEQLGEKRLEEERHAGQEMSVDEAIELATALRSAAEEASG